MAEMPKNDDDRDGPRTLALSRAALAAIIVLARAYDVQTAPSGLEEGSNPADDNAVGALEAGRDNPAFAELRAAILRLPEDAQQELVALAWLGRGDGDASGWDELVAMAAERREGLVSRYLAGLPMLGDYLEEGAATLGIDLTDEENDLLTGPS